MDSGGVVAYSLVFSLVPVLVAYIVLLAVERRGAVLGSTTQRVFPVVLILGALGGAALGTAVAPLYRVRLAFLADPALAELLATGVVTPLAEELGKGLVLLPLFLSRRIRSSLDGLLLGLAAGAGFAAIENLLVAVRTFAESGAEAWIASVRIRMGYGTVIHMAASSLFGACLGAAVASRRWVWLIIAPMAGLAVAVGVHGAWNALLLAGSRGAPAWLHLARAAALLLLFLVGALVFRGARPSDVEQVP